MPQRDTGCASNTTHHVAAVGKRLMSPLISGSSVKGTNCASAHQQSGLSLRLDQLDATHGAALESEACLHTVTYVRIVHRRVEPEHGRERRPGPESKQLAARGVVHFLAHAAPEPHLDFARPREAEHRQATQRHVRGVAAQARTVVCVCVWGGDSPYIGEQSVYFSQSSTSTNKSPQISVCEATRATTRQRLREYAALRRPQSRQRQTEGVPAAARR